MRVTDLGHGRGWLDAPAAASLARIDRALGRALTTNSTGRTRAEQAEARRKYLNGTGAYAAPEGTSPHEFGNAIDTDERHLALMADHGWRRPLASEPWHFVYHPSLDNHRHDPTATLPEEDEDMHICLYLYTPTNTLLLVDHMNKRIRDLGNSAEDPVRDHYSRQPYTKVADQDNREGLPDWAVITGGYTYV